MPDGENKFLEDTNEQIEVRRQKLAKFKETGTPVYPNDFRPSQTASELVSQFTAADDAALAAAPQDIRVAGRIMAIRRMGKASFFHLQDRRGRLQVYVQQNTVGEAVYGLFRTLDIGDIVAVSGHLFRTRTKELTLDANDVRC